MIQPLLRFASAIPTASTGAFAVSPDSISVNSFFGTKECVWPLDGTFRNLYTELSAAPGTGDTRTFSFQLNGTNSALVTAHGAADTIMQDDTHLIAVTAGNRVLMHSAISGSPASADVHWCVDFESGDDYSSGYTCNITTTTSGFVDIFTGRVSATALDCKRLIPCPGNITRLIAANMSSSVGAGTTLNFYVYLNGVKQDGTGGTVDTRCQLTNVAQYAAVTMNFTLAVVRGDEVYVGIEVSGSYPSSYTSVGMVFTATNAGESILASLAVNNPADTGAYYASIWENGSVTALWGSANISSKQLRCGISNVTIRDMLLEASDNPGAGNTRTFELMANGAVPGGAPTAVITDSILEVSDTGEIVFTQGDVIGPMRHTPASTPVVTGREWWSFVIGASLPEPPGGGSAASGVNPPPGTVPTGTVELFTVLTLDGVDYPFAVSQLNDDPTWYGGEKDAKILDISSIKYQLTKEGGPQAVTFTISLLDGDRVFHNLAADGTQIRGGFCAVYVTDRETRDAEGDALRIGAGYITKYEGGDSFVFKITVKDALSVKLAKIDREPILPQGRFTLTDFPAIDPSMDGKSIPLVLGRMSDQDETSPQGLVPPIWVGQINLNAWGGPVNAVVDAYIWAQGAFVHNGILSIWYNNPTEPLVRVSAPSSAAGTIFWTPFWPEWATDTGLATNYVEYNGRRYTPFFLLASDPRAELVRQGNILLAANIFGTEENGDTTGNMIDSPTDIMRFVLVNYVFTRYLTGAFNAIPTYEHNSITPYSWIDTDTFDDVKTYFDARLANGYRCGLVLGAEGSPITVFQFLQDMCTGVWMDIGINLNGQLIASVYDPTDTPVATFDATADIEKATYTVTLDEAGLINEVEHEYGRYYVPPYAPAPTPAEGDPVPSKPIPSYGEYRSGVKRTGDTASQTMVGDILSFKLQNNVVQETATATDVPVRILAERVGPTGAGPHSFSLRGGWHLLDGMQLGKNIRVIHPAKFGTSAIDLCRVTAIDIAPLTNRVTLSGVVIDHSA